MSPKPPIEEASAEKRAFFRVDTVLPLTIYIEGEQAQPLPRPTPVNLSMGGAGIVMERSLAPGDSLLLTLFLPSGPPIQTQAKVVRSVQVSTPATAATYQIGLQFIMIDEKDQERLNSYLFKVQVERRRTRSYA
ncbi:MAG: PilZ domain-containing protein [Nitrospirota bacterium]|nr:PilZ domain-containing protein [Nitrospirota bacterium]